MNITLKLLQAKIPAYILIILGLVHVACEKNPVDFRNPEHLKIIFIAGGRLYVMNSEGSEQIQLSEKSVQGPSWSPDGSKIVFASNREDSFQGYVINVDGSKMEKLTNMPERAEGFSWSPDGSKIIFNSGHDSTNELYIMNADGSDLQRLTNNSAVDFWPDWSPDGSKIKFYRRIGGITQIWVINPDGTGSTSLTNYELGTTNSSCWSPDGTRIAFVRYSGDIYVMAADGSNKQRLTNFGETFSPVWSPGGLTLAFVSSHETGVHIYLIDSDGRNLRRLTNRSHEEYSPTWSPIGSIIAFCSYVDEQNYNQIFLINPEGGGLTQLSSPYSCGSVKLSPVYYR